MISYLPVAVRDFDDILDYVLKGDPLSAEGLLDELDKGISELVEFPEMGNAPKDDRLRSMVTGSLSSVSNLFSTGS